MYSMLLTLLFFVAGSASARPQFALSPDQEWKSVEVSECPSSPYSGPLKRTVPTLQDFDLTINEVDNKQDHSVTKINFIIDDSQNKDDEPKNVIVLNAGKKLNYLRIQAFDVDDKSVQIGLGRFTEADEPRSVCQDTKKNLLIVTMKYNLANKSKLGLKIEFKAPIDKREKKGLYRIKDLTYKADFSNGQAGLIAPCIDDGRESPLKLNVVAGFGSMIVTSPVTKLKRGSGYVGIYTFNPIERSSVDKLSFDVAPK